jgi:hypothetical protein
MKAPNAGVKGRDPRKNWSPDIFGKFILTDSNLFLHEGKLTTGQSAAVFLPGASMQALAGDQQPTPAPPAEASRKATISYHMNSGHYAGCDPRDLANQAIIWLEQQIENAEK